MAALCTYCGSTRKPHNDHVRAKKNGGVTTVIACAKCNQSKGAKQLMVWFRWVKRNDPYRWNRVVVHNSKKRSSIAAKVRRIHKE